MTRDRTLGPGRPRTASDSGPSRLGTVLCALVLTLLHAVTAYCVLTAYMITPDGPWDSQAVAGAQATAGLGLAFAVVAGLLTLLFVKAEWLRRWWFALPALLALAAIVRLVFPPQL